MNLQNIYAEITNQIIENLESAGSWQKLWTAPSPVSLNKHFYKGINILTLSNMPYEYPVFGTYKQIRKCGGRIKKGERSRIVVFYKKSIVEDKETKEKKSVFLLRYFRVFNVAQAVFDDEGLEYIKGLASMSIERKHERCIPAEDIVLNMPNPPKIEYTNLDNAAYYPISDVIRVPDLKWHKTQESFYSTLFHELTHSTGHPKRLNRQLNGFAYDKTSYSKEELVAELGASYLTALCGLEPNIKNSSAYIKSWSSVLKDNTTWITWAAAKASCAVDYITRNTVEERSVA